MLLIEPPKITEVIWGLHIYGKCANIYPKAGLPKNKKINNILFKIYLFLFTINSIAICIYYSRNALPDIKFQTIYAVKVNKVYSRGKGRFSLQYQFIND